MPLGYTSYMNSLIENIVPDPAHPAFFPLLQHLRFGELHLKQDENTGMLAIIAIHSTRLGPALGGCRYLPYPSLEHAIIDALRLAHGMSYKAAISGVAFGGGKAVLIKGPQQVDSTALFKTFGQFVHELGGRYITAEDSGTSISEMDIIRKVTPFVTGHSLQTFESVEPSPLTAFGVRRGIEACVHYQLRRDNLQGIHVAIQGVGHVGYHLAKELYAQGAKLTVCDMNAQLVEQVCDEMGASAVPVAQIHKVPCDVFSPCALSNAVYYGNIEEIQTAIIAGSANNQLESSQLAYKLKEKGILYAPDFVINAGGLIHVEAQYLQKSEEAAKDKVKNIYQTLTQIFLEAQRADLPPLVIAQRIAEQRLG